MSIRKKLGITVLPEYIQSEGVKPLLDRLVDHVGVSAVTTSPYVMQVARGGEGVREPPADAGAGHVRMLERPLWGERELNVQTAPSFLPERSLYEGLRYQPPAPTDLTKSSGHVVKEFISAAHDRGIEVFFQVQAAIPPGYRVQFGGPIQDDVPRLPDGTCVSKRVANNASLASPHLLAYQQAMIADLCRAYPDIDGIRFDWPEYPPYELDSIFTDFGSHAEVAAKSMGFDFELLKCDAAALYRELHGQLKVSWLKQLAEPGGVKSIMEEVRTRFPNVLELVRFKTELVVHLLEVFSMSLQDHSDGRIKLLANAFPPPWSAISGFDFQRASLWCHAILVKLYGMHWAMMLKQYGDQIMRANAGLDESQVVRVLVTLLDIADDEGLSRLSDYAYPAPDQPHPMGDQVQQRKINQAQAAAGDCPVFALAHAYGPLDDFKRRLQMAAKASDHGVWVNRYAYLSDAKLDILADLFR